MTHKITVETEVYTDGLIKQHTYSDIDNVRKRICTEIIQTKDVQVRECLIKLGWTPPSY